MSEALGRIAAFRFLTLPCLAAALACMAMSSSLWAQVTASEPPPAVGSKPPTVETPTDPSAHARRWVLRLPMDDKVVFSGMPNLDKAGMPAGAMMYPAPNAGGLLVAILTHGVLVESSKTQQKSKLQEEADMVLAPFQPVLEGFTHRLLMEEAAPIAGTQFPDGLIEPGTSSQAHWLVDSAPAFFMTSDARAVVLQNVLSMRRPEVSEEHAQNLVVRVVSAARDVDSAMQQWLDKDGRALRSEAAWLFVQSLGIAFDSMDRSWAESTAPHKTYRYLEGSAEKMERGQLVRETCDRLVIRNLRGWLLSVPSRQGPAAAGTSPHCIPSPAQE